MIEGSAAASRRRAVSIFIWPTRHNACRRADLYMSARRRRGGRRRSGPSTGSGGPGPRAAKKKGLTQESLALLAQISFEHLNRVENYRAMPSVEVIDRIARALGFDRVSLFLGLDNTRTL